MQQPRAPLSITEFSFVANLQPIFGFRSFLLDDSDFVNKVVPRLGPICLPIICTNRGSGFYQLISNHIANFPNRQCCRKSHNSQSELLRSSFKLDLIHLKFAIRNSNFEILFHFTLVVCEVTACQR